MPKPAQNLDEVFQQVAQAIALAAEDPRRVHQTQTIINGAGKLVDLVRTKIVAAQLAGCEPDAPELGTFKGQPLPKVKQMKQISP